MNALELGTKWAIVVALVSITLASSTTARESLDNTPDAFVLRSSLIGADRLVTNEYAYWNPGDARAVKSPVWDVSSGSLFVRDGVGWSGLPDRGVVDAESSGATNSSVFRAHLRNRYADNVEVSGQFRLLRFVEPTGAGESWNGLHLWVRYRSEAELYVVSIVRKDGRVAIKRKNAGGPANGGTYTLLAEGPGVMNMSTWHHVLVRVRNLNDADVHIELLIDDRLTLVVNDVIAAGQQPIVAAGSVGVRADGIEFEMTGLALRALA